MTTPPDCPMVLLRHELPDGSAHFDWLLARSPEGGPLISFRLDAAPEPSPGPLTGERLSDHRDHYLSYEGPVSGNRGEVRRVRAGACWIEMEQPDRLEALTHWPHESPCRLTAIRRPDDPAEPPFGEWSLLIVPLERNTDR